MKEITEDERTMEVEYVARVVEQNSTGNIDHAMGNLGSMGPSVDDAIAELLVAQMGSIGHNDFVNNGQDSGGSCRRYIRRHG